MAKTYNPGDESFIQELVDDQHAARSTLPDRLDLVFEREAAQAAPQEPEPTEAPAQPVQRFASLQAVREAGYQPVAAGMYRKAHSLWSVSMTPSGEIGVWRHAPEPTVDALTRDRSLVGRRARARVHGRVAGVTIVDMTDEGIHIEHEAAPSGGLGGGFTETMVIPADDLLDVDDAPDMEEDEALGAAILED